MESTLKMNLKKVTLFIAILSIVFSNNVNAQELFTLSGTVFDEHKNPLPNATVKLLDTKFATATNIDGKYEFQVVQETLRIQGNNRSIMADDGENGSIAIR